MKIYCLLFLLIFNGLGGFCSNLTFSNPILYLEGEQAFAVFNVSWDHSWNNEKNHDAVWLFFKSIPISGQANHIKVLPQGHTKVADFSTETVDMGVEVARDSVGLFIFPQTSYRGNISLTLRISLDRETFRRINNRNATFKVFGIEMVHIPEGSFTLGDPSRQAPEYGSIYQSSDGNGELKLPTLTSEKAELEVSENGALFYQKKEGYEGDQTGLIPSAFPKGVAAYYMMKYEITEGQYVTFLNTLPEEWQSIRNVASERNYTVDGGSILNKDGQFSTPYADKPCKFMSWEDEMAFADWAGLRPMTEFEFTKASRGDRKPSAGEFPWGTNSKFEVQRMPNDVGVLEMNNGWGEEKLSEENLAYFGASYYWVMDLAGSMWERGVSIGHPAGRNFTGSHGDGQLDDNGLATNEDWPSGKEDAGGVGFRGGGFYGYNRGYHEYNPFSPVAYRPYGGWHGISRNKAYGGRLVRSSSR